MNDHKKDWILSTPKFIYNSTWQFAIIKVFFKVLVNTYVWSLQGQFYLIHPANSSYCICNFNKLQRIMRWRGPLCRAITGLQELPNPFWGSRKTFPESMGMGDSLGHPQSNWEIGIPQWFSAMFQWPGSKPSNSRGGIPMEPFYRSLLVMWPPNYFQKKSQKGIHSHLVFQLLWVFC